MFSRKAKRLHLENVSLEKLAEIYGTPSFIYSESKIIENFLEIKNAFSSNPVEICFSVKSNSNLAILQVLANQGAGFDIVSGGELARVLKAGGDPKKIVFSGVGKQKWEILEALKANILCFNVESSSELKKISSLCQEYGYIAPISFRVNPDIDPKTHPYISTGLKENKFGIPINIAMELCNDAHQDSNLRIVGLDCHIGSQITEIEPFLSALQILIDLVGVLSKKGITLSHIDIGGGIGIRYKNESVIKWNTFAKKISTLMRNTSQQLILEPGRSIVGDAGLLLTRVDLLKKNGGKNFAVVDAAMNDLLRPALYQSWHEVIAIREDENENKAEWEIVGPICETGDFLAKGRLLALNEGDLVAILDCGAYGFCMSSNYNSRPRAAEILVTKNKHLCIRKREQVSDLFHLETLKPS
ncbi:MAG: diaminopimelate decarboxylase [Gammaproteobacteria bacterium]|nr:diaminopimelate decarboxylase [Gammaproteobacteria bacterium]